MSMFYALCKVSIIMLDMSRISVSVSEVYKGRHRTVRDTRSVTGRRGRFISEFPNTNGSQERLMLKGYVFGSIGTLSHNGAWPTMGRRLPQTGVARVLACSPATVRHVLKPADSSSAHEPTRMLPDPGPSSRADRKAA